MLLRDAPNRTTKLKVGLGQIPRDIAQVADRRRTAPDPLPVEAALGPSLRATQLRRINIGDSVTDFAGPGMEPMPYRADSNALEDYATVNSRVYFSAESFLKSYCFVPLVLLHQVWQNICFLISVLRLLSIL